METALAIFKVSGWKLIQLASPKCSTLSEMAMVNLFLSFCLACTSHPGSSLLAEQDL